MNKTIKEELSLKEKQRSLGRMREFGFDLSFFRFFLYAGFMTFLVSCTTIQRPRGVLEPVVQNKSLKATSDLPTKRKHSPTSESYFHTIIGLQYENSQTFETAVENDKKALGEYLIALKYDPDAFFLLKRVALLFSKLGNHEDALIYAERAQRLTPNNGDLLILMGDIYVVSGEREKGLEFYREGVGSSSNPQKVYFKIAGIYADQGDLNKSEAAINKGTDIGPPSTFAHYYLGMLAIEKNNLLKALDLFRESLALDPYFELAHMAIANIYERQSDHRAAINVYRHVLNRINPRNRQAVTRLVQLLVQKGALDDALKLLTRLYDNDPSNQDLSLLLSRVFVEKNDIPSAIDLLFPLVSSNPGNIRLRVYLATLYEKNDEIEKALSSYQTVLEQSPSEYDVRIRLGSLYFYRLNQPEKALLQGELARKINPQRPEPYLFIGLIHHNTERYLEAEKSLLMGIKKNPKMSDLHFHLGATYDKLNQFDNMVQQMEQAIKLSPRHANALNYLGYTFADKGVRLNEAIDLIKRALVVKPDDGYYIDSLAWAYYRQGNLQNAVELLQKAVLLVPEDPVIHEHLGEIYLKKEDAALAKKSWERSLTLDPNNDHLISRFIEAGFGLPPKEGINLITVPAQDAH